MVDGREAYAAAMREGHVHAWGGRWRVATGAYRRALEALPGDPGARSSLAAALARAGSPAEALTLFEGLTVARPDDSTTLLRVAELRQRVGRVDEADDAYLNVAELYRAAGQADKARAVWQRLIDLSGHRPHSMARLAAVAGEAGAADLAERAGALAQSVGVAAAVATVTPSAGVDPPPGDEPAAALAARLRESGAVRASLVQPAPMPPTSGALAEDEALAGLARDPFDLTSARALGLAVRARAPATAAAQLADAADAAEVGGNLGLAVELIRDRLPLLSDPLPSYRRIVRLALLGEAVEVAADAHLAIARHLLARAEAAPALSEARRARTVAPLNPRIQAEAADLLRRLSEPAEAADADRRAFQLAPRVPIYAVAYAASSAVRGALAELQTALDAVADGDPPDLAAVRAAADEQLIGAAPAVLWARGRLWAAIDDDVTADVDLAAAARTAEPIGPAASVFLAERRLAGHDAAGALALLRPWLEQSEFGDLVEPERLIGLALSAADAADDAPTAIACLRRLCARDAADATTAALLAERLAAAGDAAGAAAELVGLAERERAAGNLETAAEMLDGALALTPEDQHLLVTSADLSLARGDSEAARRCYLRAAALPGPAALSSLLAAADLAAWGARVDLLRRAVAEHPREAEPRRRLIAALIAAGQASQAAAAAAELAELLHGLGDRAGALSTLDQARRLDPWNAGLTALHDALRADGSSSE